MEEDQMIGVMVAQWYCPDKDRTAVFFLLSPRDSSHPIWETLKGLRAGQCAP